MLNGLVTGYTKKSVFLKELHNKKKKKKKKTA
jgi:hypothetical protein